MEEIKFRAISQDHDRFVYGDLIQNPENGYSEIGFVINSSGNGIDEPPSSCYIEVHIKTHTISQYTGYKMKDKEVYFGDLVSNNFKSDKEVIREVVMHEGCISLYKVRGSSRLGKFIKLHDFVYLNFSIIGNIYQNQELLK